MRLYNLYADADGESHFRDIEIELSETMFGVGLLSKPQPVSTVMFRQVSASTTLHGGCTPWSSRGTPNLRQATARPVCWGPVKCCSSKTLPAKDTNPRASTAPHFARSLSRSIKAPEACRTGGVYGYTRIP
jgi:hypothetical protein